MGDSVAVMDDGRVVHSGSMAELAWHYGEPFADSSALVTYALSRETRQAVTVALTGDGADETLLGYARYFRYGAMRRRTPPEGARRLAGLYRGSPPETGKTLPPRSQGRTRTAAPCTARCPCRGGDLSAATRRRAQGAPVTL